MRASKWIAVIVLSLTGCAPGLGSSVGVGTIGVHRTPETRPLDPSVEVNVRPLGDARKRDGIGEISGRVLSASGDVSVAVQQALEDHLRSSGVHLRLFNTPSIGGEVRDWYVKVQPGFPSSTASANAELQLVVYDPKGRIVYRGTYSGEASAEHPFMNNSRVETVLGDAMAYAIEGALSDERLIDALRQFGA